MYDIAILGLGPAGSTLARLLDGRFRVLAVDKKSPDQPSGFRKPCGGLLATDAQKALSRLNLTLPKNVLVDPQIFAVRTLDTGQNLLRHYQRFYINLDRHKFDQWLIGLIPSAVDVETESVCTSVERDGDGFVVRYRRDGLPCSARAKFIVGADGSQSLVRKTFFPKRTIARYLSIQQWFAEQHATPFYMSLFDRSITDSYCWSASKDGMFVFGGAFPLDGARERFERAKDRLSAHGVIFGPPLRTEACMVSMPRGLRSFCVGRDGVFLIGEAAGFISPSSLEGISYAINSARVLAGVLNAGQKNPGLNYRLKSLPTRIKLLAKTLKSPFMYNPLLRRLVMMSGLLSINVVGETPPMH